jgi:hypothetical protein
MARNSSSSSLGPFSTSHLAVRAGEALECMKRFSFARRSQVAGGLENASSAFCKHWKAKNRGHPRFYHPHEEINVTTFSHVTLRGRNGMEVYGSARRTYRRKQR